MNFEVCVDFDAIDWTLRKTLNTEIPFAGKRVCLMGDLRQLPPVVSSEEEELFYKFYDSPYFFDSEVYQECNFDTIELDKVFRQEDEEFIDFLNKIRNGNYPKEYLDKLNTQKISEEDRGKKFTYLMSTNKAADTRNEISLHNLPSEEFIYHGILEGDFKKDKWIYR